MFDLQKQLRWSKLKVGIVITFAFLTLFIAVFFAGGIEDIFSPKEQILIDIKDVRGLRKGSPVWISGIEIGSVQRIDLHHEYGAIVTILVNRDALRYIKNDSQASIHTMGLLGDKYIELSSGSPDAPLIQSGTMIRGTTEIEIKDVMETGALSIIKINDFIEKLGNFVTKIEEGEGLISKFISDPTVYNNLQDSTDKLSEILSDIKNKKGTMGMLLEDNSLYNKLSATADTLEEFSKKLNEGTGTLNRLVEDSYLYDRLVATAELLEEFGRRLNKDSGTLYRLVEDPELYENLNTASRQLSLILEGIDRGEGTAGALIKDDELAIQLKEAIVELKELTKDIKENPKKYFKFSLF
jgi:phospholipid/cholesterol/gamma-HCH transport system substrate-binding protein